MTWNLPILDENKESPAAVVGNSSLRQGMFVRGGGCGTWEMMGVGTGAFSDPRSMMGTGPMRQRQLGRGVKHRGLETEGSLETPRGGVGPEGQS